MGISSSRAFKRQRDAVRAALDLADHDVVRVLGRARVRSVGPNEAIIVEGDEADAMYVIVHGKFEVAVRKPDGGLKPLRVLGAGTCVGEMGLLEGAPRRATVTCRTDEGEVIVLTAPDVRYLLDGAQGARIGLAETAAERAVQLNRAIPA
jgi:CRP-like cAMP-binding protein